MGWQEKRERDNYLSSHLKRVKGNPTWVSQVIALHPGT